MFHQHSSIDGRGRKGNFIPFSTCLLVHTSLVTSGNFFLRTGMDSWGEETNERSITISSSTDELLDTSPGFYLTSYAVTLLLARLQLCDAFFDLSCVIQRVLQKKNYYSITSANYIWYTHTLRIQSSLEYTNFSICLSSALNSCNYFCT